MRRERNRHDGIDKKEAYAGIATSLANSGCYGGWEIYFLGIIIEKDMRRSRIVDSVAVFGCPLRAAVAQRKMKREQTEERKRNGEQGDGKRELMNLTWSIWYDCKGNNVILKHFKHFSNDFNSKPIVQFKRKEQRLCTEMEFPIKSTNSSNQSRGRTARSAKKNPPYDAIIIYGSSSALLRASNATARTYRQTIYKLQEIHEMRVCLAFSAYLEEYTYKFLCQFVAKCLFHQ